MILIGLFVFFSLILTIFIICKIATSSNKSDQKKEDAIDSNTLDTFKDLYLKKAQFKENNKNF